MSAAGYVPGEGDRVMVRRWEQPTLADADPARVLSFQFAGTVVEVDRSQGRALYHFDWDDLAVIYDNAGHDAADLRAICPDAVFLPAGEGGPQAYLVTEMTPVDPGAREPYRVQLSPDMAVTLDGSQCVVLDITDPRAGVTEHRVTVSSVDAMKAALDGALAAQRVVTDAGNRRRYAGLGEARRARGQLTRPEAVDWLIARGRSRSGAVWASGQLRDGFTDVLDTFGMTYSGHYWTVPRECEDGRACENSCATGPCSRRCQSCQRLAGVPTAPCPACPDAQGAGQQLYERMRADSEADWAAAQEHPVLGPFIRGFAILPLEEP